MWAEIFGKMPWVTHLKRSHQCERFRSHAPMMLYYPQRKGMRRMTPEEYEALRVKWMCKNSARWSYRALKKSWAKSGTFCWSHLLSNIDMDEEARIDRWLAKHYPGLQYR